MPRFSARRMLIMLEYLHYFFSAKHNSRICLN